MPKSGGILALIRQAQGLNPNPEEESALKKLTSHVPGIVTFADHNKALPWSSRYSTVLMFADISGFTALCERYSAMQNKGIDQLTKTLNDYLGAIVDGIVNSEGDVLKFAGDAILAVWRVNTDNELSAAVAKVVRCCLDIQSKCGEWKTDIGVTLTVKMGVSSGEMNVTFLGNNEFRVYVELGKAVSDVNAAEHFCQSGYVVLSPEAWNLLQQEKIGWNFETMDDGKHIRVLSESAISLESLMNLPSKGFFKRGGRKNAIAMSFIAKSSLLTKEITDPEQKKLDVFAMKERLKNLKENNQEIEGPNNMQAVPTIKVENETDPIDKDVGTADGNGNDSELAAMSPGVKSKFSKAFGSKLGKGGIARLRNVVKTVTEMRLDEALRLYILPPVLKKLDDGQPLEFLSEMRQVSIVFMNMVLDEEMNVTNLLQKIFEVVYSNTKAMYGCLNKVFLFDKGCTFLVIFGLPGFKHERDCAHALICSFKMHTILKKLKGIIGVSIGVTTGTTFCGVVGHTNRHEYSVIGRKVNMAARLMMHYPGKVTCDDDTFQWSRLPATHFEILITKRMKGLRNVGTIREFFDVDDSTSSNLASVPHFQFPLLGREKELAIFKQQLDKINEDNEQGPNKRHRHIVFVGASGIGKTRLLNTIIIKAEEQKFRVVSVALKLNDACQPHKLSRHIVRMTLSAAGYSRHIDKEPALVEALKTTQLLSSIYLINEILDTQFSNPNIGVKQDEENRKRKLILTCIVRQCLETIGTVVIAIDDAQNIDTESWSFLARLIHLRRLLVVCTVRPVTIETPPCPAALEIFEDKDVIVQDIGGIEMKYMCGLACQLMEVTRIPKDLERLLRARSHGVPFWCEQLLVDMASRKQIMIVHNDGDLKLLENSISPNKDQILRLANNEDDNAEEYKQKKSFFLTTDIDNIKEVDSSSAFLADLGYVHDKPRKKSVSQERIAIFAPDIIPEDIPIPPSMKDLTMARLDSMRATDQLVVKCAAVLGKSFTRDMLETVLPKVQRVKARRSFKRLHEGGIFECATVPSMRHKQSSDFRRDSLLREGCYCSRVDIGIGENVCDNMRFKNLLLRDTAYEILMESQRKELHEKAAEYLEKQADEFRNNLPYYILERDPPSNQEACQVTVAVRRPFFLSNRIIDGQDSEVSEYIRRRRRRRAIVSINEVIGPMLRKLLEAITTDNATEMLLKDLLPLYNDIIFHWKAADRMLRVIELLLEAISVAIAIGNTAMATNMINEVQSVFESLTLPESEYFNTEATLVFEAKLKRLRAKTHYLSDEEEMAFKYMSEAMAILGLKEASDTYKDRRLLRRERIKFFFIRLSTKERKGITRKTVEQGYCLDELYQMDKKRGNEIGMEINALQQLKKVYGRPCHLHQFVNAYSAAIECEKSQTCRRKLETELFASCADRKEQLAAGDFYKVGKIYAETSAASFQAGELSRALSTGIGALEIGEKLDDPVMVEDIAPNLILACILTGRYKDGVGYLQKFRKWVKDSLKMMSLAWVHSMSLELVLDGGAPIETIQDTLAFATDYMQYADAVAGEYTTRYYLAMSIAALHARRKNWKESQRWFNYWEMYESSSSALPSLFLYGHARLRKLEVMLLSYCTNKQLGQRWSVKRLEAEIKLEFEVLKKIKKANKSIKPRLYHLKAYYNMLRGRTFRAYNQLFKSIRCSKKQKNKFELEWAVHNRKLWLSRVRADGKWINFSDQHIYEMNVSAGMKKTLFTLPR